MSHASRPANGALRSLAFAAALAAAAPLGAASAAAAVASAESLPTRRLALEGLAAAVEIELDDRAIPTVKAEGALDAYRAQGFLHARDRLLQMDLYRRNAAGEIAALAGGALLPRDLAMRPRGLRLVAETLAASLSPGDRAILEAYAAGVNEAIRLLPPPPEYALLGGPPRAWSIEDSLLSYLGLFLELTDLSRRELAWGAWRPLLHPEVFEFLLDPVSRSDATIVPEDPPSPRPIPSREAIDLRRLALAEPAAERRPSTGGELPPSLGSNAFAVAGHRTADGRAILAADPHLALMMPNTWHRIRLAWPGVDLVGASLPGMPGVIFGSNGHVAWGFTNLTGDFEDWIVVEADEEDPSLYRTPEGLEAFGERVETLSVRGEGDREIRVRTTRWGPVVREDWQGRPLAWRWTGQSPASSNVDLLAMATVRSLDAALGTLARWKGPPQNAVVADREGRIGWVVTGYLPDREGRDGRTPYSLAEGGGSWSQPLPEALRPSLADPEEGVLFTANHRPVPLEWSSLLGSHWADPARATRLRELLGREESFDEAALLAIQLDTAVAALEPWRRVVLDSIEPSARGARGALRRTVERWSGRADEAERAPVALERLRQSIADDLLGAILAHAAARVERRPAAAFPVAGDEPWLRLIEAEPEHLLPSRDPSWPAFLRRHVDRVAAMEDLAFADLAADAGDPPAAAAPPPAPRRFRRGEPPPPPKPPGILWGEANRLQMRHPFSIALPMLARGYDIEHEQPGHRHAVRVATPGFGASLRMVVSPGREEEAILLTPGGQSGDPSSVHYRDLHEAWRRGTPDPMLPGDAASRIILVPGP